MRCIRRRRLGQRTTPIADCHPPPGQTRMGTRPGHPGPGRHAAWAGGPCLLDPATTALICTDQDRELSATQPPHRAPRVRLGRAGAAPALWRRTVPDRFRVQVRSRGRAWSSVKGGRLCGRAAPGEVGPHRLQIRREGTMPEHPGVVDPKAQKLTAAGSPLWPSWAIKLGRQRPHTPLIEMLRIGSRVSPKSAEHQQSRCGGSAPPSPGPS
jgi:hypothetical protein